MIRHTKPLSASSSRYDLVLGSGARLFGPLLTQQLPRRGHGVQQPLFSTPHRRFAVTIARNADDDEGRRHLGTWRLAPP